MGKYHLLLSKEDSLTALGEVEADFLPRERGIVVYGEKRYFVTEIEHKVISNENSKLESKVNVIIREGSWIGF